MKKIFIYLCLVSFFFSCEKNISNKGAIVFSFDDQYVKEWSAFQKIFEQYGIKATFFVSRAHLLDATNTLKLKMMENTGHEIACHSVNHLNPQLFNDSIEKYYAIEVEPSIHDLQTLGFQIESFAYPFGSASLQMDDFLKEKIKYIRKATYNKNNTTLDHYDEIFATKDSYLVTNSMGIDCNYGINIESFRTGIERAKKNNEVLIIHAHRISDSKEDYNVTKNSLIEIFELCKSEEIKSIRIKDLESFFEK